MAESDLTVAVTGPTGTFGFGLIPVLQGEDRVRRIVGIARRPFDPAGYGWTKMEYRRGDVRDPAALRDAFSHADVVVHLAFLVTGAASGETIRSVNLDGTLNAFRAAAEAGARRFVYASSVAAYGFHADNPVGMTEEWPVRPSARLFYARQKAELEQLLAAEAAKAGGPALYLLRPPIVLGPHAIGAKNMLPAPLAPLSRALTGRLPLPVPVLVPALPLQVVHEEDLGQAFGRCVVAAGPPGAYNLAADGILTAADVTRELGLVPLPLPVGPAQLAARAMAALPFLPPAAQWIETASHPLIVDTTRAREKLGWTPSFTALEALRDTVRRGLRPARPAQDG
ncbi:MAG TPA: NAD-dependent epimerase/dehydratase family protein [Streptosporangiaceae bacterium]|nr:NAD-dependent epimerase/dehydratase family protein [Streptosporangiaceae bacterium]